MFNPSYSGFECKADCPDRKVGCRSGCERWARDEAKREKIRENKNKDRVSNDYSVDVSIRRRSKELRKKNRRTFGSIYHQ